MEAYWSASLTYPQPLWFLPQPSSLLTLPWPPYSHLPPWCSSDRLSTPWLQCLCTRSSLCWTHSSHFFQVSARMSSQQTGPSWPIYLKGHSLPLCCFFFFLHSNDHSLIPVYCLTSPTITYPLQEQELTVFVIVYPQCLEKCRYLVDTQ